MNSNEDPLEHEILVTLRTMTGEDHIISVKNTDYVNSIFHFASDIFHVSIRCIGLALDRQDDKRYAYSGGYQILHGCESIADMAEPLKKVDHVLHLLFKEDDIPEYGPPRWKRKHRYTSQWRLHSARYKRLRRLYGKIGTW
jgi:hypothetical protein